MIDIAKMPRVEQIKYRLSNIGENIGEVALEYIIELENLEKDKDQIIFESDLKIKALEDNIEKMKCCGNCKYHDCCYVEVPCSCCIRGLDNENENDVDEWEIYD